MKFIAFLLNLSFLNIALGANLSDDEIAKRQKAAAPYKVKEANKSGNQKEDKDAQIKADIELADNLPNDLKNIVGQYAQFTPEEIEKANKDLDDAQDANQVKEAINNGANNLNMSLWKTLENFGQGLDFFGIEQNDLDRIAAKVKVLLDNGADPNFSFVIEGVEPKKMLSALIISNSENKLQIFPILKLLLNAKVDLDQKMHPYKTTFRQYLNKPDNAELLKLYNDYLLEQEINKTLE